MQTIEWWHTATIGRQLKQLSTLILFLFYMLGAQWASGNIIWPIQGQPIPRNKPVADVIQSTVSGKPESGLFGCVRNNGYKFHEGIDIKSQRRDRYNRPLDKVVAVMPGRVAYINKVGGKSSYGIYVILEHIKQKPRIYSLYAHLHSVESGISIGRNLASGQVIGLMGHTASTGIPVSRAHLHFEIGLRLTDNFQTWYNQQKFKTKNEHGIWNGMNMVGLDTLDFFRKVADGKVSSIEDYFRTIPEAFRLRVRSPKVPNLMRRYPGLLTSKVPADVTGWDIAYSWYGLPTSITPLRLSQTGTGPKVQILKLNKTLLAMRKCRSTLLFDDAGVRIGAILKLYLELIFEV